MRYFKHLVIILITIFSVNGVWAQSYSTQMTPTIAEKLSNPIALVDMCSGVKIVEWRSSSPSNQLSKDNIRSLNGYCNEAMKAFPKFVKSRGFKLKKAGKLHTSVCFMPVSSSPRSLNDDVYRFSSRTKTYDSYGNVDEIWGYYQRYTNHIYVRSTGVNHHRVVFIHELFHSASYYYGIYDQHEGNKDLHEENLAQDFTAYLGYGR